MRRRLRRRLVFVALVAGLTASAADTAAQTLKLATLIPTGSFWDRSLREMASTWERETGGDVRLRIYPGGVAGDDPDMIRKIRIGQLQAATVTVSGLTEIDPAFAIFEVPMFFASYEELFHVMSALRPEFEARLEAKGFKLLHWAHGGWIHFFTTTRVESLEDFQARRIFVWAGNDRMTGLWRDHGFRPVPLAATDVLTGLETGLFQALPSTPIAALSLQWFRSAPHMIDLGLAPLVGATLLDLESWRRIDPQYHRALLAAADLSGDEMAATIPEEEKRAVEAMKRRGLEIIQVVGADDEASWRAATDAFAASMRDAFVPSEIFDQASRARDAYRRTLVAPSGQSAQPPPPQLPVSSKRRPKRSLRNQ